MDRNRGRCSDERERQTTKQVGVPKWRALALDSPQTEFTQPETPFPSVSSRDCDEKGHRKRDRPQCYAEMAQRPRSRKRESWGESHRIENPRWEGLIRDFRNRPERQSRKSPAS